MALTQISQKVEEERERERERERGLNFLLAHCLILIKPTVVTHGDHGLYRSSVSIL